MRTLFLLTCLVGTFNAFANDTLTRGQIYNFDIGDTFYYKNHECYACNAPHYPDVYSVAFVTDKFYSSNGDTVFYEWNHLGIQAIDSLGKYEAPNYRDTANIGAYQYGVGYDSTSIYGKRLNTVYVNYPFAGSMTDKFAEGLGLVFSTYQCVVACPQVFASYELVYYSKGNERWGTRPILSGLETIESGKFRVYPSVNNGVFIVERQEPDKPADFIVYNALGEQVAERKISDNISEVRLTYMPKGLYVWKIQPPNGQGQSGKMILE